MRATWQQLQRACKCVGPEDACSKWQVQGGRCFCDDGFSGALCAVTVANDAGAQARFQRSVQRWAMRAGGAREDPCRATLCSDHGLCARGSCTCHANFTSPLCSQKSDAHAYLWRLRERGSCSKPCGFEGTRSLEYECIDGATGAVASSTSLCDQSATLADSEVCNRFACNSEIYILGLELAVQNSRLNFSANAIHAVRMAMRQELSQAANVSLAHFTVEELYASPSGRHLPSYTLLV